MTARIAFVLLCGALLFGAGSRGLCATYTVERWRVVEITLTSAKQHANPFGDVTVDAAFTGPGMKLVRPAFWDGGATWKIRFAAPATGAWAFATTCSDTTDTGLHGQRGTVNVTPYRGNLAIYQHGFVKASANGRYFVYADGTPFFYLGDTHWEAMHERFSISNLAGCPSQFKAEVDKRVSQGFTVYQSEWMAGGQDGPDQEAIYYWDDGISDADMPGFHNADRKFQYLADSGLVIANALNWRGLIPKYDDDYLRKLGRYWAARYGAYPVLWTMGQETDSSYDGDPPNFDAKWQTIAQALAENDAYHHPLSAHTCNAITASASKWREKPFHTWYAVQQQSIIDAGFAEDYWETTPTKPAVHYEPPYENFWTDAAGERTRAYMAFLSGFCGFGYGVAGVWDDNYTIPPHRDSGTAYDPNPKLWYDGLGRASGDQMTYVKRFLSALDWWKLTPRFDVRSWGVFPSVNEVRIASDGSRTIVALLFNKGTASGKLRMLNPNTSYKARWYDPRAGAYTVISGSVAPDANGEWTAPPKPDSGDWVLLLQANDPAALPPVAKQRATALEGAWSLDGAMDDSSGRGHKGTQTGAAYVADRGGQVLALDGAGAYASIPSAPGFDGGGALTIAVWAKIDAFPTQNATLVNKEFAYRLGVGTGGGWHLEVATTQHPWYSAGTVVAGEKALEPGKWYHLVGTYDGDYLRVYLNGQFCGGSSALSGSVVSNASPVDLGRANATNVQWLKGQLSDLRLYSTALTAEQVRALYEKGKR
jgi:hypothetical protein